MNTENHMMFGAAKELITPNFPIHMIGFNVGSNERYNQQPFEQIHDDLYVRGVVLDDGKCRHLIMAFDLLFHDPSLRDDIAAMAADYGFSPEQVLVNYTHTHYAPAVEGYFSEMADSRYETFLRQRAASCLRKCLINMQPGTVRFGSIRADENICRRKPENGVMNLAPNLEGLKDDELNVLCIDAGNGTPGCILFSYSCHPVTMKANPVLSSEFPGRVCSLLEAQYYGCVPVFLQAMAADVRPRLTAAEGSFAAGSFDDIEEMSLSLALRLNMVLQRKGAMRPLRLSLKAERFTLPLKLDVYDRAFFEKEKADHSGGIQYRAEKILEKYDTLNDTCDLEGGVWQIAEDLDLVFFGGEVCSDTKRVIRAAFPERSILVIAYCDATAYIPSDRIIREGGYEAEGSVTEYELKGSFALGVDDKMTRAIAEAFDRFETI